MHAHMSLHQMVLVWLQTCALLQPWTRQSRYGPVLMHSQQVRGSATTQLVQDWQGINVSVGSQSEYLTL